MSRNRYDMPSSIYRVPQRDRSGLRMAVFGAAIIGLGAALAGGYWLLNKGGRPGEIPVIEAESGPMRVRPENPGGMQVEGQDDVILSGRGALSSTQRERLAPMPEMPVPLEPPVNAVPQAAQPQQAPATQATEPPPEAQPQQPEPPRQTALPAQQAAAPAQETAPEEPAVPPAVEPPRAAGRSMVQFGAMTTEEAARNDWQRLQREMPDLLGGRQAIITRIERDGRALWRLRTGGFADVDAAKAFCERVRAAGGNCLVPAS